MNNYYRNNYYSDNSFVQYRKTSSAALKKASACMTISSRSGCGGIIEIHITKKYIFALNKTNKSCSKNNTLT